MTGGLLCFLRYANTLFINASRRIQEAVSPGFHQSE